MVAGGPTATMSAAAGGVVLRGAREGEGGGVPEDGVLTAGRSEEAGDGRRPAAAPRTTSPWGSPRAVSAPAHRPGWTVAFSSFGDAAPAMDRVQECSLYRAPCLLLRRHVVTFPARILGEEVQDTYKRRRWAVEERTPVLVHAKLSPI